MDLLLYSQRTGVCTATKYHLHGTIVMEGYSMTLCDDFTQVNHENCLKALQWLHPILKRAEVPRQES